MNKVINILLLESVPGDAALIKSALTKENINFRALIVDSKEAFIQSLAAFSPNIILSSPAVPSLDAHQALDILRTSGLQIPFILVTSAITDEFAAEIFKRGAEDYVLKDQLNRLGNAVRKALENSHLRNEKQKYKDELRKSESRFRVLIEQGYDVVVILDAAYKPTYVSPSIERVFGYTEAEALQRSVAELIYPEDKGAAMAAIACSLAKPGVPFEGPVCQIKHRDGSWRWTESTITNMLHNPEIQGIVFNLRDVTNKKLAEKAIRESEEKYRSCFDKSLDAILLTYPDGTIYSANPAACQILQMSEAELCRAGRSAVIDPADPMLPLALQERQLRGKVKTELTFIRKDGSKFPAEVSSTLFKDEEVNQKCTIIFRDTTERKLAEEELKKSEEQYKFLFRYSPLPLWIFNLDTYRILDVNQAAINHYGYSREEFLQMTILDIRPKEEIQATKDFIEKKTRQKKGKVFIEFKVSNHLKKDKTSIRVEMKGYSLTFQNADCIMVMANDITEREATLQKLKDSEEKLLTANRIARLGYWELSLKNHSIYWSEQTYTIWGQDKESFIPTQEALLQLIHPEDRTSFSLNYGVALKEHTSFNQEFRIMLQDGGYRWLAGQGHLVKDAKGTPIHFRGTIQDVTERKQVLEKLVRSESRLRSIVQSQTNYLIRTDLEGNYTYSNDKFIKDFGWIYPDNNILGKNSLSSIMDYHHQRVIECSYTCLTNPNKVYQVELDKPKQDGGVKSTLWDFIVLTNEESVPIEVQCVGIDITDRVIAEKALKESNARYELVSRATSDAIWDWELKSGTIYWGGGFQTLFGHETEAFSASVNEWSAHLHPDDLEEVVSSLNTAIEGSGNNWHAEYRFRKADGMYTYVVDRGFIIRDEQNRAVRMVGAIQDVTEQKSSEIRLQELNRSLEAYTQELVTAKKELEKLSLVASKTINGVIIMDAHQRVEWVNGGFTRITGYTLAEVAGKKPSDVLKGAETNKDELQRVEEKVKTGVSFNTHFICYRKSGESFWMAMDTSPVFDEAGNLSQYISIQKDITFRKEAEANLVMMTEELYRQNQDLQQFTYIISHNLRAPVANALGLARLLTVLNKDSKDFDTSLAFLGESLGRLDVVLRDINQILSIRDKRDVLEWESISLAEVCRQALEDLQASFVQCGGQVSLDLEEGLLIHANRAYLYSIFHNLLTNAVKYRSRERTLQVSIEASMVTEGVAVIYFSDNGSGIDLNKAGKDLFKMYKRFHTDKEGKGIGLFLVKMHVEAMGGRIEVSSKVGKGTSFIINLKGEKA